MNSIALDDRERRPERLYVYECRGRGLPRQEPLHTCFLGIWPEPPHYYLFFSERATTFVADWVASQPGWAVDACYDLDYEQWQQIPRTDQRVGPFLISLSGRAGPITGKDSDPHTRRLTINPGVVFGSGLHPTTRGSLLAIAHWCDSEPVRTAVDFGTGTGILAIACASCGVDQVLAVDCNPMAVKAALRNGILNGLAGQIHGVAATTLNVVRRQADLLVMNIEWPSLLDVFREGAWSSHPVIVSSGFLGARTDEVIARFIASGTHSLAWRTEDDGWPTLIFTRRGQST